MAPTRIVLDSGVLSAIAEGGRLGIALRRAVTGGSDVLVPTAVIAESTRGDHRVDTHVNRALKLVTVVDLDEGIARSAASLRHAGNRRRAGTIDAIVIATADVLPGTHVMTGDPDDLRLLASIRGRTLVVPLGDLSG